MNPIFHIVLTGGPCAGKTTALQLVSTYFKEQNFQVFTLPESPTLFSHIGVDFLTSNHPLFLQAEKSLLTFQMMLEDQFRLIAEASSLPSIILCDRGTVDISAYLPENTWEQLLKELNIPSKQKLLDRYHQVLHLTSTAQGAETFYSQANNQYRSEGVELARKIDTQLQKVWTNHPRHTIIKNYPSFEEKVEEIISQISTTVTPSAS